MSISAPVRPPRQNSFTRRVLMQALDSESDSRRAQEVLLHRAQVAHAEHGGESRMSISAPVRPPPQNSFTRRERIQARGQ